MKEIIDENEKLFKQVQRLREEKRQLRSALSSLKRGGPCYCSHGSPIGTDAGHEAVCRLVSKVMVETEK